MPRLLRIVRGPSFWLRAHPLLSPAPGRLVLDLPREPPLPWAALRALLALLSEAAEAEAEAGLRARLHASRAPLSLVLRGLLPQLDAEEEAQRLRLAAQLPAYLSHNSLQIWPLRQAWTELLMPALEGRALVVRDVDALDVETLTVLWGLLGRCPTFHLTLGVDPGGLLPEPLWRRDGLLLRQQLRSMAALDFAEVHAQEGGAEEGEEGAASPSPAPRHPLDDGLEARAFAQLGEETLDPEAVLEAVEACFASYGFTPALRLGLALLAHPSSARLEEASRRRLHLLIAIAAYNRQVSTRGESEEADQALAELLDRHLRASLEGEEDPVLRAHAYYRLAINEGRRRGTLPAARALAEEAVALAREAEEPFHEAWALNGLAYVRGRMRELGGAIEDVERAFALTEAPLPGPLEAERSLTRAVLADNLATLHTFAGDREKALEWQERWAKLGEDEAGGGLPSSRWLDMLRDGLEIERAIALSERGLEVAERFLSPDSVDYYGTVLAELRYRRGEAKEALLTFRRTLAIQRRSDEPALLRASLLSTAMAAWRAGELAEAEARVVELLASPASDAEAAELSALHGLLLANAGDPEASEEAINRAIELAVASEERDLLLRVACAAGEACVLLERVEEARAAYLQALAISEQGEEPPSAADRFEALVGLLRTEEPTEARVEEALDLLEPALREAESWWRLEALREAYDKAPAGDPALLERALAMRVRPPGSSRARVDPPR